MDHQLGNETLVAHIDRIRRQADKLERSAPQGEKQRLIDLVQALEISLEEMEVAQEEIQSRNDQLEETQRLLEEERSRYQTLFDLAPYGHVVTDAYGNVLEANATALHMLSRRLSELRDRPLVVVVDDSLRLLFRNFINGLNTTEQKATLETRFKRGGTASTFPVSVVAAPLGPKTNGHQWLFRDISEQLEKQEAADRRQTALKEAFEQAETERKRLEALIEMVPVGVALVNMEGRVLLTNTEARRSFGVASLLDCDLEHHPDQLQYRRPDGTPYSPDELPLYRALTEGRTTSAEEMRIVFGDGRTLPTLINTAPVNGPDGQRMGALVVLQDLTPIEEVERLRNDFLAMVSRALRTPLTAIKGSVAMAFDNTDRLSAERVRELCTIVDEQAAQMRRLIDGLVDVSRIDAGKLPVILEPVDLGSLIVRSVAEVREAHGDREFRIEGPTANLHCSADSARLRQVLRTFLENAVRFSSPRAPVHVNVSRSPHDITVRIRDYGNGIEPARIGQVFRRFVDLFENGHTPAPGSGLGLAIAKGVMEAHGGSVFAESAGQGLGATFGFTLPLSSPDAQPEYANAREPSAVPPRRAALRARDLVRILLIDGDVQSVRLVRRLLEESGHRIAVAKTIEEGVQLVREVPDLCIVHIGLPNSDGKDVLGRLRAVYSGPLVVVGDGSNEETVIDAFAMGADDFVSKPFSSAELAARAGALLRRQSHLESAGHDAAYSVGGLAIDFEYRRVTVEGRPVALTAKEYGLLTELARYPGRVFTSDEILMRVWGMEYRGEPQLVRSFIRNLRRRLGDDARHPRYIFTESRVGYRLAAP